MASGRRCGGLSRWSAAAGLSLFLRRFFVSACRFSLRSCPVRVTLYLIRGCSFFHSAFGVLMSASLLCRAAVSSGSASVSLRVSRSGVARIRFAFWSPRVASSFVSSLPSGAFPSVRLRGGVVVARLAGPARIPSWF